MTDRRTPGQIALWEAAVLGARRIQCPLSDDQLRQIAAAILEARAQQADKDADIIWNENGHWAYLTKLRAIAANLRAAIPEEAK